MNVTNLTFIIIIIALCSELSAPANGSVTVTGQSVGDTATYTCDDGFELIGNASRNCKATSDWSFSVPVCRRKSK